LETCLRKIDAGSNRLLGFTQTLVKTQNGQPISSTNSTVNYSVDANGSMTSDGLRGFIYNDMNRLSEVEILKTHCKVLPTQLPEWEAAANAPLPRR
jgi:hypothetical protein